MIRSADAGRFQRGQFFGNSRRRTVNQCVLRRWHAPVAPRPAPASAKSTLPAQRKYALRIATRCSCIVDERRHCDTVRPPHRSPQHRRCARPSIHPTLGCDVVSSRPISRSVSRYNAIRADGHRVALHVHHERVAAASDLQHAVLGRRGSDHRRMRLRVGQPGAIPAVECGRNVRGTPTARPSTPRA